MRKIPMKKKLFTLGAMAVAAGATTTLVMAYRDGSRFDPAGKTREFQSNQVVFSTEDSLTDGLDKQKKDDSELWEKQNDANSQTRPQSNSAGGYLFDGSNIGIMDDMGTMTAQNDNAYPSVPDDSRIAQTVYDFVNNTNGADMVLNNPGNKTEDNAWIYEKPDTDDKDDKDRHNSESRDNQNNSDVSKDDNSDKTNPDRPGSDDSNDNRGDNKDDNKDTPADDIASTIKDPVPVKKNEDYYYGPNITPDYSDDSVTDKDNIRLEISTNRNYQLYKGQNVTANELFCALNTYMIENKEFRDNVFNLGSDQYDRFIRIDGVSFDGGQTYETFPVVIPTDLEEDKMVIKIGYRFSSAADEVWSEEVIHYEPADSCVYVLSEKLTNENDSIDESHVLNADELSKRYLEEGDTINLLGMQSALWEKISNGEITDKLFTGWKENGKYVDYFYPVTTGRHILEPGDFVEFDSRYKIGLKQYWMSDTYDVGILYNYSCFLQTFEYYEDNYFNYADVLDIPGYVQAIDADQVWTTANRIRIPDSVLYINYLSDDLMIAEGYDVDENNLKYSSEDGVLFDKNKTAIYGIPYLMEELVVPQSVENIYIPSFNYLNTIDLRGREASLIPQISFENLRDGSRLVMDDDQIMPYLELHYEELDATSDINVAADEGEDTKLYKIKKGAVLSYDPAKDEGMRLEKVLQSGSVFRLPEGIDTISEKAFVGVSEAEILFLPSDSEKIRLDEGCFDGSNISVIICCDKEQKQTVDQFIKDNDIKDIKVQMADTDPRGYQYLIETEGDEQTILLLQAPADITEFDGTIEIEGEKTAVTEIGEEAFANNTSLIQVTLPKEVKKIHAHAFKGCSALEGMLINATDTILLGDGFIDDCYALRYVASNAKQAEMENDYSPYLLSGILLKPTDGIGYSDGFSWFNAESDVRQYTIISGGEKGRFLYGVSESGIPWLLIKGNRIVDEETNLPVTTEEFLSEAMEGTEASTETGAYTINWNELSNVRFIDDYAFSASKLSGDIELSDLLEVGSYAFSTSGINGKVTLSGLRQIGSYAFYGTGITEINVSGDAQSGLSIGMGAFNSCSSLSHVVMDGLHEIWYWTFIDCPSLTSIEIDAVTPTSLIVSTVYGFQFIGYDDDEKLTLKIAGDSEEKNKEWIKAWRYPFMGYVLETVEDNFANLKENVIWDMFSEGIYDPTEEQILDAAKAKILKSENHLRKMLGMDLITADELDMSEELASEDGDDVSGNSLPTVSDNGIYYGAVSGNDAVSIYAADSETAGSHAVYSAASDRTHVNAYPAESYEANQKAASGHTELVRKKAAGREEITK